MNAGSEFRLGYFSVLAFLQDRKPAVSQIIRHTRKYTTYRWSRVAVLRPPFWLADPPAPSTRLRSSIVAPRTITQVTLDNRADTDDDSIGETRV